MSEIEKLAGDIEHGLEHTSGDFIGQDGTQVKRLERRDMPGTRTWAIKLPDGQVYRLNLELVLGELR